MTVKTGDIALYPLLCTHCHPLQACSDEMEQPQWCPCLYVLPQGRHFAFGPLGKGEGLTWMSSRKVTEAWSSLLALARKTSRTDSYLQGKDSIIKGAPICLVSECLDILRSRVLDKRIQWTQMPCTVLEGLTAGLPNE